MVTVIGGGLAGAAAGIAGAGQGASVTIYERSRLPRHKVCGEFLSPEAAPVMQSLGCWQAFQACAPAVIRRMSLCIGGREIRAALPEPAYGLSRYRLDRLLLDRAAECGCRIVRSQEDDVRPSVILTTGRTAAGRRGSRLFGFKAHFRGHAADEIRLDFYGDVYVGVNPVEEGLVNVCGVAAESALDARGFDADELLAACPRVAGQLAGLERAMDWLFTGPLVFGNRLNDDSEGVYRAGDALSFVDPFTGSGMVSALITGRLAGIASARRQAVPDYLRACRRALSKPFAAASLFRAALASGWAARLAGVLPARLLFRLTRPALPDGA